MNYDTKEMLREIALICAVVIAFAAVTPFVVIGFMRWISFVGIVMGAWS